MKTLLTIITLLIKINLFAPNLDKQQVENHYTIYKEHKFKMQLYDEMIEFIKISEGLRLSSYDCPSGHKTIAYGHLIKRGEHFSRLTLKQAENLLKDDFRQCLEFVNPKLSYNKRLAIAHFIFSLGIGNYNRSTLKKKIDANESIDTEIVKWIYYHKKGIKIKSKNALRSRLFELKLYNYGRSTIHNKNKWLI